MEGKIFAGKYRAIRELNAERAGRTWLAETRGGTQVVVKVVRPADAAAAARVERDVSLVSGVHGPGLPDVIEWGHDAGTFFVVRPFVPGADLELELAQQGAFAPMTVAKYGAEAAAALGLIHARGLVHGNVRTANLIRTPDDEIVLVGSSLGHPSQAMLEADMPPSTAHYLAPEQVEGGAVTAATDVYALGIVLYELLIGRVPFDGPTASSIADQQAHRVPEPVSQVMPEVPRALEAVVMKALEKSPESRYANGAEMRAALDRVLNPEPVPAPARGGRGWLWGVVGVLIVIAALLAAWASGLFGGGEATVPDLIGMSASEASAAVGAAGLELGSVSYAGAEVAGVTDGDVSSQSPAAGDRVDHGTRVDLVLAGFQSVQVPDVVGQPEAQATVALQSAGLVTGLIANVATTSASAGTVLAQDPAAGTSVKKGSRIDLQVAQTPTATAVPDTTGLTRSQARTVLQNAGFVVTFTGRSSASVASGRVIEQSPSAGVTAQPGSTVNVVLSTGPAQTTVPNVVGMTQAAAVNALTAAGFKTQVTFQTGGGTSGDVAVQSPAAGVKAATGSTVVITVVQ